MEPWRTAIVDARDGQIRIRGNDVTSLMTERTFTDTIFLLHRSRAPGLKPPVRLKVNRRSLDLGFTGKWLAAHPLTQADLAEEAEHLLSIQVRLRFG